MNFMQKINLNFICRVFDILALLVFIIGIIFSVIVGLQEFYLYSSLAWATMLCGILYSFLAAISILFFARIGDAIDDIRNKICYPEANECHTNNELV